MPAPQTRPSGRLTKHQSLCARLTDMAQGLGPEAKLPTVVQLRASMGVSIATLNHALAELETQNVIYRRHGVGIYVSPRLNQKAISLICDPSFFRSANVSPFWDMLVDQARRRAAARNEAFSFHFALPGGEPDLPLQDGLVGDLRAGRVHGVLSVGLGPEATAWIAAQQVPLVAFAGPGAYGVELDGKQQVRLGVSALADEGCRRVGLWSPVNLWRAIDADVPIPTPEQRLFQQALRRHKLTFVPALYKDNRHLLPGRAGTRLDESHQEQGYRTAMEVFAADRAAWPDGVVITDDMMAHGALVALQNMGVRAGHDVRIATHANRGSDVLIGREADLTLIEIDPAEVVQTMFALLETLMAGQRPAEPFISIQPKIRRRQLSP